MVVALISFSRAGYLHAAETQPSPSAPPAQRTEADATQPDLNRQILAQQDLLQQQADGLKQVEAEGMQAAQTLSAEHDAMLAAAKALAEAQDRQNAAQRTLDQAKASIAQATTAQARLQADARDAERQGIEQ